MDSIFYQDNERTIDSEKVPENLNFTNEHTEEEFQNFVQRVTEISTLK